MVQRALNEYPLSQGDKNNKKKKDIKKKKEEGIKSVPSQDPNVLYLVFRKKKLPKLKILTMPTSNYFAFQLQ